MGGHEEVEHAAPDNATAQAEHAGQDALRNHGTAAGRPAQYALHQFLSQLAYWSGQHIDAVLSAGDQAVWVEVWCDALADVPERHLRLRFPDPDAG